MSLRSKRKKFIADTRSSRESAPVAAGSGD